MHHDDVIEIHVKNWDKYNPNTEKRNYSWFRFEHNTFRDPAMYRLSTNAKMLFTCLLCACCEQRRSTVRLSTSRVQAEYGIRKDNYFKALKALIDAKLIESCMLTLHNITPHNITIHENKKEKIEKIVEKKLDKKNIAKDKPSPIKKNLTQDFIIYFCEAYKEKYNSGFQFTGKNVGIAKRLTKDFSIERLKVFVNAYFKMHDSWFITKAHDLITFEQNIQKISAFSETGKMITSKEAACMEKAIHSNKELDLLELKKLEMERQENEIQRGKNALLERK